MLDLVYREESAAHDRSFWSRSISSPTLREDGSSGSVLLSFQVIGKMRLRKAFFS